MRTWIRYLTVVESILKSNHGVENMFFKGTIIFGHPVEYRCLFIVLRYIYPNGVFHYRKVIVRML